jgi:hypothetical protein
MRTVSSGVRSSLGQERAERPEVEVEVFRRRSEVVLQPLHGLIEPHERQAELLDLLVGQVLVLVHAPEGLFLHQLPDQLDDGEDEGREVVLDGLRVRPQPLSEGRCHRSPLGPW